MPVLAEPLRATTVSRVSRILDASVSAFHRRPIRRTYRFLFLDGVVLKRKTGIGAVKRVVLVALGMTHDGKKEVIDFLCLECGFISGTSRLEKNPFADNHRGVPLKYVFFPDN